MSAGIVDVAAKPVVKRQATAEGKLQLTREAIAAIQQSRVDKGDVAATARAAGLLAAKATPSLLPHCHPIPITSANVDVQLQQAGLHVVATVETEYKTGIEMEALTAVTVALLTAWDMVKPFEKDADGQYPHTRIHGVRIIKKVKEE